MSHSPKLKTIKPNPSLGKLPSCVMRYGSDNTKVYGDDDEGDGVVGAELLSFSRRTKGKGKRVRQRDLREKDALRSWQRFHFQTKKKEEQVSTKCSKIKLTAKNKQ